MSPLDRAKAAADADPASLPRFWALMLETPLCVPLADEARLAPLTFPLESGAVALAFDDDARMAAFCEGPTPYVALEGRALVGLLAEAGLGLGLNLGDAPSATLLDAATVAWLAAEAGGRIDADALEPPFTLGPPAGAEPGLLAALAARLADFPGMAAEARLARLTPDGGASRLLLALVPAPAAARGAEALAAVLGRLAQPYAPPGETVAVAVLRPDHPAAAAARRQGVDLLARVETPPDPRPPGPPILR